MSDLISREAALNATKMAYIECIFVDEKGYEEALLDAAGVILKKDIEALPAVDAVEVVRCKDCVHYYDREPVCLKIYSDCVCHQTAWQERKPNDFCSYGERKDNETD